MITNSAGQRILQGGGTWPFTATVDGADIAVHDGNVTTGAKFAIIVATNFGGTAKQDPYDDGTTASGISTRNNPLLMGCALPMSNANSESTQGSPLPKMPYLQTEVEVCNLATGAVITVKLVDLGPAKTATSKPNEVHAIDLTRAAYVALGGDLDQGWMHVAYRVLGAARYVGNGA